MEIKKVNILSGNVDFANGKKARFVYLLCKCFLPRIARINTDYFIALQKDSLLKDRERNHLNVLICVQNLSKYLWQTFLPQAKLLCQNILL